jgi:hypothetical protein
MGFASDIAGPCYRRHRLSASIRLKCLVLLIKASDMLKLLFIYIIKLETNCGTYSLVHVRQVTANHLQKQEPIQRHHKRCCCMLKLISFCHTAEDNLIVFAVFKMAPAYHSILKTHVCASIFVIVN